MWLLRRYFLCFAAGLWIAACNRTNLGATLPAPTLTIESVPASPTPIHTSTPVQQPPTIGPTYTPTFAPTAFPITPTAVPSLNATERTDRFEELLRSNAGCDLPCWWSIEPGITPWFQTEQLLSALGSTITTQPNQTTQLTYHAAAGFDREDDGIFNRLGFFERDSVVDSILIRAQTPSNTRGLISLWESYAPETIILKYGAPTRVWLSSEGEFAEAPADNMAPYEIWLFYDDLGFLIRYSGKVAIQPMYLFCPTFGLDGNLGLGIELVLQSVTSRVPLERDLVNRPLPSLGDASGLTIGQFADMLLNPGEPACFETPRDFWNT
jgi:hypothetical protein